MCQHGSGAQFRVHATTSRQQKKGDHAPQSRRGASRGYLVTHGCRFRFYSVPGGRAALVSSWLSTWSSCGSVFFLVAHSSGLDSSASSGACMYDGYWPVTEKIWTCCSAAAFLMSSFSPAEAQLVWEMFNVPAFPVTIQTLSGCVATQNGHHADRVRGRWVRFKTHDGFREGLWQCCVAHSICAQGRVRDILRARHEGGDPACRVRMTRFVLR